MDITLALYTLLGFDIQRVSPMFARACWNNGVVIEFSTAELTGSYDKGWTAPGLPSTNTLNFQPSAKSAVDDTYLKAIATGYCGTL